MNVFKRIPSKKEIRNLNEEYKEISKIEGYKLLFSERHRDLANDWQILHVRRWMHSDTRSEERRIDG